MAARNSKNPRSTQPGYIAGRDGRWGNGWLTTFDATKARAGGLFTWTWLSYLLVRDREPSDRDLVPIDAGVAQFINQQQAARARDDILKKGEHFERFLPVPAGASDGEDLDLIQLVERFDGELTRALVRDIPVASLVQAYQDALEGLDGSAGRLKAANAIIEKIRGRDRERHVIEQSISGDGDLLLLLDRPGMEAPVIELMVSMLERRPELKVAVAQRLGGAPLQIEQKT